MAFHHGGAMTVLPEADQGRLASRPFLAMSLLIAASTPLLTEGAGNNTALGFLVYYGGGAGGARLAGGGGRFPGAHIRLFELARAGVRVWSVALPACLVR